MISVLDELSLLRCARPLMIDTHNRNRYCLRTHEKDGTKTAYCFSTPIYNQKSRKMVDMQFHKSGDAFCAVGSNADVTVSDHIRMENASGYCLVCLPQKPIAVTDIELRCGVNSIFTTTNGIAYKAYIKDEGKMSFDIEVNRRFTEVRANDKCFTLMQEQFRPFVAFSCIGTLDTSGALIAPAKIEYQTVTDTKYHLTVSSASPLGVYVLFEMNLYEPKLFQDTTVESANPKTNNAFGGTAFIGNTALFGEQWLYSRPDYGRLAEFADKRIHKAVLHLPKHNKSGTELSAFRVLARFCSFGSNWDNKVASGSALCDSATAGRYHSLDITELIVDPKTGTLTTTQGLILKSKVKGSGFSAVSTSDSYYAPQILEFNYS